MIWVVVFERHDNPTLTVEPHLFLCMDESSPYTAVLHLEASIISRYDCINDMDRGYGSELQPVSVRGRGLCHRKGVEPIDFSIDSCRRPVGFEWRIVVRFHVPGLWAKAMRNRKHMKDGGGGGDDDDDDMMMI